MNKTEGTLTAVNPEEEANRSPNGKDCRGKEETGGWGGGTIEDSEVGDIC